MQEVSKKNKVPFSYIQHLSAEVISVWKHYKLESILCLYSIYYILMLKDTSSDFIYTNIFDNLEKANEG